MKKNIFGLILLLFLLQCCIPDIILFTDDFNNLPRGPIGSDVGAHTEYHFLHEAKPKGQWAISTFRYNEISILEVHYPRMDWKELYYLILLCLAYFRRNWSDFSGDFDK